jgi:cell division protein FtsW
VRKLILKQQKGKVDKRLFYLTLILVVVGLIAVTDASFYSALRTFSDKFYFAKQQAWWALVGTLLMIVFSYVDYKIWEKYATPFFVVSVLLLIAVLIPGIGSKALGAKRWIVIGSLLSIQPSEIVKLSLSVYFAKLTLNEKKSLSFFIPLILVFGLIMMQPDLGTALVLAGIGFVQIFISGMGLFNILLAFFLAVISSVILILISDYRRDRLLTFLQLAKDPLGKSYHIRQILIALGSGGLFGVGIGQSKQKYLFLPEAATDSIFAVIAEEVGFLGASLLIVLFALYIYFSLNIVINAPDTFSKMLSSGIVVWIGGQAFVNIASMLAIVPLTGIPLPFISYGGSSLVTVLVATGILLNISRNIKYEKQKKR